MAPIPSRPLELSPQQKTCPPLVTPQVCSTPVLTEVKVNSPETGTGTLLLLPAVEGSPNWPRKFCPQQNAWPPLVTPQVWLGPALNDVNVSPPETGTGSSESEI